MIRTLALLWLCSLLSGCTWVFADVKQPDVQLIKVQVIKARLWEQELLLHFRIDNPNDYSLSVYSLNYKLRLNDLELVEGESSSWFTVPANGHGDIAVPVTTNLWQHLKSLAKMLKSVDQPIRYRFDGELDTGLFEPSLYITRSGEILPSNFIGDLP